MVCGSCGFVSSDVVLDSRAEWRTFESDNNKCQRVGAPNSLAFHDMGLATIIGSKDLDSSGRKLDTSVSSSMHRLRLWDARTRANSSSQRNLMRAFGELGKLKHRLGLHDAIVEKAAYVYRKAEEKQMIRGRSITAMLAAAVYMACREMGTPKSIREMTITTEIKSKALSHCYRLLVRELDIKVPQIDPTKYVAQISNRAGISEKSKRVAITIMQDIVKNEISAGKNPVGLAAAVLYLACQLNNETRTQENIADASGVTEVTMRNRLRDLKTRACVSAIWKLV
jgi:transcription initiation factor TFIIB